MKWTQSELSEKERSNLGTIGIVSLVLFFLCLLAYKQPLSLYKVCLVLVNISFLIASFFYCYKCLIKRETPTKTAK